MIIAPDGDRQFQAGPQDSSQHLFKLRLTQADRDIINTYDVLHTSIYSNIEADLNTFDPQVKISFDFSDCRDEAYLAQTLPLVDLAFFSGSTLSDEQAEALAAHWLSIGPEVVVITRGGQPALLQTATQRVYQQPKPVEWWIRWVPEIASLLVSWWHMLMVSHSLHVALKLQPMRRQLVNCMVVLAMDTRLNSGGIER